MSEEAKRREEIELKILEYNSRITTGGQEGFANYLKELQQKGEIESYFAVEGKIVVEYDGSYYEIEPDKPYYKLGKELKLGEGKESHLISKENADELGKLTLENRNSYTIIDEIETKDFNFVIPDAKGKEENAVDITLLANINIDNKGENDEGLDRSAIELEEGAILNLYIGEGVTATVDSSTGKEGDTANGFGAKGGPGGKAGIHVPETATLNLYGEGTLIAIGGDAGNGGGAVTGNTGGGRRWPELEQELVEMVDKVEMQIQNMQKKIH